MVEVAVTVLARVEPVDPDRVTPGLLGFLVIVAIGLATWVLLRSLNRQLGRIDFEERPTGEHRDRPSPADQARGEAGAAAGTEASGEAGSEASGEAGVRQRPEGASAGGEAGQPGPPQRPPAEQR